MKLQETNSLGLTCECCALNAYKVSEEVTFAWVNTSQSRTDGDLMWVSVPEFTMLKELNTEYKAKDMTKHFPQGHVPSLFAWTIPNTNFRIMILSEKQITISYGNCWQSNREPEKRQSRVPQSCEPYYHSQDKEDKRRRFWVEQIIELVKLSSQKLHKGARSGSTCS